MTNSPLSPDAIGRGRAFMPIGEPVDVSAGEHVDVTFAVNPSLHLLQWRVAFPAQSRLFRHSTWQGSIITPEDLMRARPDRVPLVNAEGQARSVVLSYCDGTRTVREVEQAVLTNHPGLFPTPREISNFVYQVLGRDTA